MQEFPAFFIVLILSYLTVFIYNNVNSHIRRVKEYDVLERCFLLLL